MVIFVNISGLSVRLGVCKLHTQLHGAGLRIEERIDEIDASPNLSSAARVGKLDFGRLSGSDEGEIRFIQFAQDPHLRKIHDRKQVLGGIDERPMVIGRSLHHDSGDWRVNRNRALDLSFGFETLDVLVRHIPQAEAFARGGDQVFRTLGRGCDGAVPAAGFEISARAESPARSQPGPDCRS